jgi:hypothetical protein
VGGADEDLLALDVGPDHPGGCSYTSRRSDTSRRSLGRTS